jgi:hypothetical protein
MKTLPFTSFFNTTTPALAASLFFVWLFGAGVPPVQAGVTTASITVRATVLPFASVKTIREPATLTITEEDVRKGFVDDGSLSLIETRTNNRRGCVLILNAGESPLKETEVTLEGHTVVVGRQGGMIVLELPGRRIVSMRYRFLLARETRPGVYPWPFSLSISPLE